MISDKVHTSYVGLSVAARQARARKALSPTLAKKLVRIDTAFAIVRHLSRAKCEKFLVELEAGLPSAVHSADIAGGLREVDIQGLPAQQGDAPTAGDELVPDQPDQEMLSSTWHRRTTSSSSLRAFAFLCAGISLLTSKS